MVFYFVWYAISETIKKSTSATIRGAKADLIILVLFYFYLLVEIIPRIIKVASMQKVSIIYPSIISITNAPMPDTRPIIKVTSITLGVIPFKPMYSNCNSSNRAGTEKIATKVSTSRK